MSSTDPCDVGAEAIPVAGAVRSLPKFWPSIVRIAFAEAALLLALAGVFVAYLNWSSEATFAEFIAAGEADSISTSVTPLISQSDRAAERCDRLSGSQP